MTTDDVRRLSLAMAETAEKAYHGRPSFRVAGKIFATALDDEHVNVMLGDADTEDVLAAHPEACEELWWGNKRYGVVVTLAAATEELLAQVLRRAWLGKAPAAVANAWRGGAQ